MPNAGAPEPPGEPGMLGETLAPLLEKRQIYEGTLVAGMSPEDPQYAPYKVRLGPA